MTNHPNRKLSAKQREALTKLSETGAGTSYSMNVSLRTLSALCDRQLVRPVGLGHMAMPANALWRITPNGRAALGVD